MIANDIVFLCICERSYPRKLAFTYLSDLSTEFNTTYPATQVHSPTLRPYAFMDFDTFISRTKSTYSDTRATQNLDKLNDELRDVTKVMTKNIEDLLYRGDNLERMGEVSSRLREDSKKYRKAAVRINWELMLKQYGPIGGLGLFMIIFIWWRFFWSFRCLWTRSRKNEVWGGVSDVHERSFRNQRRQLLLPCIMIPNKSQFVFLKKKKFDLLSSACFQMILFTQFSLTAQFGWNFKVNKICRRFK